MLQFEAYFYIFKLTLNHRSTIADSQFSVFEIPFSSESKFQLSVHSMQTSATSLSTSSLLVMKGAPEKIFEKCSTILIGEKEVEVVISLEI